MSFNFIECPHSEVSVIEKLRGFNITRCLNCNLLFTKELYCNMTKPEYNPSEDAFLEYERDYLLHRMITYKKFLPVLLKYRRTNKILDLGCGYGHFLSLARAEGWQVEGVESSDYDAGVAEKHNNLVVYNNIDHPNLSKGSFDIITLWDVIEHVSDVKRTIVRIKELLRPGGVMLLKTPDARIFSYRGKLIPEKILHFYRSYVYPSNTRQHIYHFTPEILINLLKGNGFNSFKVNDNELFLERVISGNNLFVRIVRYILMYVTWRMKWPFEFVLICEKKT